MFPLKRPYLIVPKFIIQPTWGGDYIRTMKGWGALEFLQDKKIGQSYELFGRSKLLLDIQWSSDERFFPEVGFPDRPESISPPISFEEGRDYTSLQAFVEQDRAAVLGPRVAHLFSTMPLLIKVNQAYGNSFQLHIKPSVKHQRWRPKAESWYYLERGLLTFGLRRGAKIDDYKAVCIAIDERMKTLSGAVKGKRMSLAEARLVAQQLIERFDPWQFVNMHEAAKDMVVDLSMGGLHHSWEESLEKFPLGNVVYEVQEDVMDPVCTIRAFDQGKIKDNGDVREVNIEDYFTYLDRDEEHNDIRNATQKRRGDRVLTTPKYAMDVLTITDKRSEQAGTSFCHLFVREGEVEIVGEEGSIRLSKGHSGFLPYGLGRYEIQSFIQNSVVFKTTIEC